METVEKVLQRISSERRLAIAAGLALTLFVVWIAFIAYAAIANGVMAGLGVFLTWPILLVVLSIVVAPFWLAGHYAVPPLRRRFAGAPAVAGGQDQPETITTNTFPC